MARTWTRDEFHALELPKLELLDGKICGSDEDAARVVLALLEQIGPNPEVAHWIVSAVRRDRRVPG